MICKLCNHRRCRTESKEGGHVAIWGCGKRGIRFGIQSEYDACQNMHSKCEQFKVEAWRSEVADGRNN